MPRKRAYIPYPELLASALADRLPQSLRDEMRAERASAKEVIALFSPDHNELHSLGGADSWWNLSWMLREPHKEKSRKDTGIVAKVKRIDDRWRGFTAAMAHGKKPKRHASKWPKQKIQSRKK